MPLLIDNSTAAANFKFEVPAERTNTFTPEGLTGELLVQHWNGSGGNDFGAVDVNDDSLFTQATRGGANIVITSADVPALIEGPFRGRIVYAGQGSALNLLQDWFR